MLCINLQPSRQGSDSVLSINTMPSELNINDLVNWKAGLKRHTKSKSISLLAVVGVYYSRPIGWPCNLLQFTVTGPANVHPTNCPADSERDDCECDACPASARLHCGEAKWMGPGRPCTCRSSLDPHAVGSTKTSEMASCCVLIRWAYLVILDSFVIADYLDVIRIHVEFGEILNQQLSCRMVCESPVIGSAGGCRHHAAGHTVQAVLTQSTAFVMDGILTTPVDSQVEQGIGGVHLSKSKSLALLVCLNRASWTVCSVD